MSKEPRAQLRSRGAIDTPSEGPQLRTRDMLVALVGAGFRSLGPKLRGVHIGDVYLLETPDHR